MTTTWALVPVKALHKSKSRLLAVLAPAECALLSRSMLMDVLTALGNAGRVDRVAVLTDDDAVAELAEQLGHTVLADTEDDELCCGLDKAAQHIAQEGASTVLIVPGDIPSVQAADIDELLARHNGGLSLCPAIRDGGTNAIVCSPPDAIRFQFGKDSASRHLEEAEAAGIAAQRLALPAFFRDIDLPEDVVWLLSRELDTNTSRYLRQSGIGPRVQALMLEASA